MHLNRLLLPPERAFSYGTRGAGKSTSPRDTFPDAYVGDLLSEETYQRLLARPGLFADELRNVPSGQWVIVDEVQRLPNLLKRGAPHDRNQAVAFCPLRIECQKAEASRCESSCGACSAPCHAPLCA